ncbi:hypothetical protein LCGC14_1819280 [marine sediment metagenome]|uniref:Uncharacterized protein n=1 Tax=marine sediment metagenome TaxID=412755 RepID=A0A0F9GJF9_9ZZZZ
MVKVLNLNISINKKNGQIVTTIPKRKLSKKKLKEIFETRKIKMEIK